MIGLDDAVGEQVMGDAPIGGDHATVWGADGSHIEDWELWINGVWCRSVQFGQLSGLVTLGQRATCEFTVVARTGGLPAAAAGDRIDLYWQDALLFSGLVQDTAFSTPDEIVTYLAVSCAGWMLLAERVRISASYASATIDTIIPSVISGYLAADGIVQGVCDEGPILEQASADYISVHDLLRDVAEASGGWYDITTTKRLDFRKTTFADGPATGLDAALGTVELQIAHQDYRNVQLVRAKGTSGNAVVQTRSDAAEISARAAVEGGSGQYQNFLEVQHPSSDDSDALSRLAISVAVVQLHTYGRLQRTVSVETLHPGYMPGAVVDVSFPSLGIGGKWQIAQVSFGLLGHLLKVSVQLTQTSVMQRAYKSWLAIINAKRAFVQMPGTPLFSNTVTLTTSQTWTVPNANGDGTPVECEFDCYGAGGGGSGNITITTDVDNLSGNCFVPPTNYGGAGGRGGKAISFRTLAVGTVLTINVGSGGSAGTNGADPWATVCGSAAVAGGAGGSTQVLNGGTVLAQGDGGGGGGLPVAVLTMAPYRYPSYHNPGAPGLDGGGIGDFFTPGGGNVGGAGGAAGAAGYIVILY